MKLSTGQFSRTSETLQLKSIKAFDSTDCWNNCKNSLGGSCLIFSWMSQPNPNLGQMQDGQCLLLFQEDQTQFNVIEQTLPKIVELLVSPGWVSGQMDCEAVTTSVLEVIATKECQNIEMRSIASASSVWENIAGYGPNPFDYGPQFTIDGIITSNWYAWFHSGWDLYAWLQLDFGPTNMITVNNLSLALRPHWGGELFKNVGIFIGNKESQMAKMSRNEKCAFYAGPGETNAIVELQCEKPTTGRYLVVQLTGFSPGHLMLNEVTVCGHEGIIRFCKENTNIYLDSVLAATLTESHELPGPDTWLQVAHGLESVWVSSNGMNFTEAVNYCLAKNSSLVEPRDERSFNRVLDVARKSGMDRLWIGVTDEDSEGL